MKQILMLSLLLLNTCLCQAQEKESTIVDDQKLLHWMRADRCLLTGMPYSFEPMGIKRDVYLKIGAEFSTTGIIERTIVDKGISIYDAALWQIVLSHTGSLQDWAMAHKPIEYYWNGTLNEFSNIRSGSESQIFVYDPNHPQAVTADLSQKGHRGFIFRILNAAGQYNSSDPVDGKTSYKDFPNDPRIHWEDWKPIAGENAWVVMAAIHLLKHTPRADWPSFMEFKLARELARAALYLQAENGGIRMAPLGTYYHLLDISSNSSDRKIVQELDEKARRFKNGVIVSSKDLERLGGVDYPPYHTWYYEEISTENNISWYAALRMLYHATGQPRYLNAMGRIEGFIKSMWDPKEKFFYQGAHFKKGKWVPHISPFAVDVQSWSIIVLGPAKIDKWFGEGAAYQIWHTTKLFSGVYGQDGLEGVGFTKEKDRLSIEWTAGTILAVRKLAAYYATTHPDWSTELRNDGINMRLSLDHYYFNVGLDGGAYSYSSVRRWIPFGWFSHNIQVLSLVSTAWVVLIDNYINPFEL